MSIEDYQKLTKKELTKEQKFEIDLHKFTSMNSKKYKDVFENPKAFKFLKQLLNKKIKL